MFFTFYGREHFDYTFLEEKYCLETYDLTMKRETVYFKISHRHFLRHPRSKMRNIKVLIKVVVAVGVYI